MKKILWIIGLLSAAAIGSIGFLAVNTKQKAVSEFPTSGYILDTDETSGTAEMQQYYFNAGENYSTNNALKTVSFKTVEGNKVSVKKDSYIHYSDSSMESMAKTVIFDTDEADAAALSYYAIPKTTRLVRGGDCYTVSTDGYEKDFRNFVWKISDSDYMIVSDEVKLIVSEGEEVSFPDYVQVKYKDSGVVFLTTQQGVYSTVSSDAYLELANGIRIYLGSKNVSTDQGIVMNLGQMTVNSEDLVEVAPDQEYKNENTTQPQLIVDASDGEDGEDGKDGEVGEAGKNGAKGEVGDEGEEGDEGDAGAAGEAGASGGSGTNGKNGDLGATGGGGGGGEEGDPGNDGTDASTANLSYVEDKMPAFWATIKTSTALNMTTQQEEGSTCGDVLVFVKYDDAEKAWSVNPDSITLSVLEADSGTSVDEVIPKKQGISVLQSGFYVPFTGLDPATNYLLVINAEYTDANGNVTWKDVLSKNFVTESMGVSLTKRSVTENSVVFFLTRTSDDPITDVNILLYDENKNPLDDTSKVKFLIPKNGISSDSQIVTDERIYFNSTNGVFSISSIPNVGNKLEVVAGTYHEDAQQLIPSITMEGLETDTVYYARVKAYERGAGDTATDLSDYVFPMVPFRTLKKAPELDPPKVSVSGYENAFIVSAQDVKDEDNGILSYRYEVYEKNTTTGQIGTKPFYTVSSSTPTSIKVPITGAVSIGKTYVARIVALFDNNEAELEYNSAMSAEFSSNQTWPVVTVDELKITASTVEGTLTLTDVNKTITRGGNYQIKAVLKPQKALITGAGTSYDKEVTIASKDTEEGQDVYTMSFQAQGLEYATDYNIIVYATEVTVQEGGQNVKKANYPIATKTLTTETYTPLALKNVGGEAKGETFIQYVLLSTGENTEEGKALYNAEKQKESIASSIDGVGNMGHFSAKSMENVTLELYYGADTSGKPKKVGELKVYNKDYCEQHAGDPTYYRFASPSTAVRKKYVKTPQSTYVEELVEMDSVLNTFYTYKSPEEVAGLTEEDCWDKTSQTSKLGLRIKVEDFEKITNGNHTGQPLTYDDLTNEGSTVILKAVVYDYTYFTGGISARWRKEKSTGTEYCNPIAVSNEVVFDLNKVKPDFEAISKCDYQLAELLKKNEVNETLLKSFKDDMSDKTSNYKDYTAGTGDLKTDKWGTEMAGTTQVGIQIIGPKTGLKSYAKTVKYTVYTNAACTENVAESSWIPVDQTVTVTKLPNWYFLIDAVDDKKLKRGQVFYVKTEVTLNTYYSQTGLKLENMIYPTAFTTAGWQSTVLNPENQGKENPFTDVGVSGMIVKPFTLSKQDPVLSLVQWEGAAVSGSTEVTYLLKINDLDEALDVTLDSTTPKYEDYRTDFNSINLYYGSGSETVKWEHRIIANTDAASSADAAEIFPYMISDADITTRAPLSVRYWLMDAERTDPQKAKTIALDSYSEKIITGSEVAMVDKNLSVALDANDLTEMFGQPSVSDYLPCSFDDEVFSAYFWYVDPEGTAGNKLRKAVLTMTAYENEPGEATATVLNFDFTYGGTDRFYTGTSYQKTVGAVTTTFYKAKLDLNVMSKLTDEQLKKLAEYPYMQVSMTGYYDDGSYGLIYAGGAGAGLFEYALQAQDKAKYVDTTNSERNMEDALYKTEKNVTYEKNVDKLSIWFLHTVSGSSSQTEKENVLSYSESGLSKVPRKAATRFMLSEQKDNLLKKVLPTYTPYPGNIGYSQADVALDFKSQGTLVMDTMSGSMVQVFYTTDEAFAAGDSMSFESARDWKKGYPEASVGYALTELNYESAKTITNLVGNTKYYFRVYGYAGPVNGWQLLKTTDGKTVFDLTTATNIKIGKPTGIRYIALKTGADSKTVEAVIPVTDALYADIDNSIESLTLKIYQGTDITATPVKTNTDLKRVILAACKKKMEDTGTSGKVSFSFTAVLDWKPSDDTKMDKTASSDGTTYTFVLEAKYKNVSSPSVVFNDVTSEPYVWTSADGSNVGHVSENEGRNTFLGVVPVVANNTGTSSYNNKGELGVAISGYDRLRLFRIADESTGTITATDKTKYYVKLYYRVGSYKAGNIYYKDEIVQNGGSYYKCKVAQSGTTWNQTSDWTQLSGTPAEEQEALDKSGNVVKVIIEKSIDANGNVSYVSSYGSSGGCRFYDLKPGTEYRVKVYAFWDQNNDGSITIATKSGDLDLGKSETCGYTTNWKQIPQEKFVFSSLELVPGANTSYARIGGENLSEVDKVTYQLKVNGVLQNQWTLYKNPPSPEPGNTRPWYEWAPDTMQTGFYTLAIQGMSDTTATYELVVTLYSGAETHSRLAIYGKND